MEGTGKNKKALLIIIFALVLFGAIYFFFFRSGEPQALVLDEFGNPVQATVVGQDLIVLLSEIQSIRLDSQLFDNPAFRSLTDYSVELISEPQGRANPFAEIGTGGNF